MKIAAFLLYLPRQQLESVGPLILLKAGNAPQHAQWFQSSGGDDASAIERLPAELADDLGDLRLGRVAVAAQKHGRRALLVMRVHHLPAAHAVGENALPGRVAGVKGIGILRLRSRFASRSGYCAQDARSIGAAVWVMDLTRP